MKSLSLPLRAEELVVHIKVTHLRLTNSRFCILYVRMNHFEVHLMVSSREVDTKVLRMAIQFEYFF